MVSKKFEIDTTWTCSQGCPNNKVICSHLEKLLPNIDRSQVKIVYKESIDNLQPINADSSVKTELFTRRRLKELGLNQRDSELFMLKYVDKFTLEEILEVHPEYTNISNIHYSLRQIKKRLKEKLGWEK